MPRRDDIETIALIGSGPIVIGQACEFDYSGTQALRVLRDEGYRTVLINSNPATIMTDPGWADRTYLEPLDLDGVRAVLERERPDALLPTLGGQTALNLSSQLEEAGVLEELGIELIGASYKAIHAPRTARSSPRRWLRWGCRARSVIATSWRKRGCAGLGGAAATGRDPSGLHPRRPWRWLRLDPDELDAASPAASARARSPRCCSSVPSRAGGSSSWR